MTAVHVFMFVCSFVCLSPQTLMAAVLMASVFQAALASMLSVFAYLSTLIFWLSQLHHFLSRVRTLTRDIDIAILSVCPLRSGNR